MCEDEGIMIVGNTSSQEAKMQVFDYALIRCQDVCLILVPVNPDFGNKSCCEQQRVRECLEASTLAQGLSGVVIPVWRGYTGRMKFLAHQSIWPIVSEIEWGTVAKNISGKVSCCG